MEARLVYSTRDLAVELGISAYTVRWRIREGLIKPDMLTRNGDAIFEKETVMRLKEAEPPTRKRQKTLARLKEEQAKEPKKQRATKKKRGRQVGKDGSAAQEARRQRLEL